MGKLINEMIIGVMILAFLSFGHQMVQIMRGKAADAHKAGLISYSKYTKMLTDDPSKKSRSKTKKQNRTSNK